MSNGAIDPFVDQTEPTIDLDSDRGEPSLVGRVVWHPKYGRGVVLTQDGHGEAAKCEVRFINQVTRKIVSKFLDVEEEPA